MIITRDLNITDVPGFELITVQRTTGSGVPTALLQSSYGTTEHPWLFGLKELIELRDALTVCIEEMQPAPAATRPGSTARLARRRSGAHGRGEGNGQGRRPLDAPRERQLAG
jgi:hypothetical protein